MSSSGDPVPPEQASEGPATHPLGTRAAASVYLGLSPWQF